jgi:hypothetical protein
MAWKGKSSATFSGSSGQMAVMAELLHRKCNAAIPLVDVGTDVFAFRDDREDVARIQVKTALGKWYANGKGYCARFNIPTKQLGRTDSPPLFYALAVRLDDAWGKMIVVSREKLQELWNFGLGSNNKNTGSFGLHIRFRLPNQVEDGDEQGDDVQQNLSAHCGDIDLTAFVDAWETLPPLQRPVMIDGDEDGTGAQAVNH